MTTPIREPVIGDPVGGGPDGGGGSGGGTGGSPTGVGTTIFDVTINKQQADSVLKVLVYASLASGDDLQLTGFLTIDGSVRQTSQINLILDTQNSAAQAPMTIPAFQSGLAKGSHRIIFSVLNKEPDSALTVRAGATIEITELKRAAL